MVRTITIILFTPLLGLAIVLNGFAQRPFVDFVTTNHKNEVCQGKTMGVIPTLLDEYQGLDTYSWDYNTQSFRELKGDVALVNTDLPGEKHLGFTLAINDSVKLDTVFVVTVLPKPEVKIKLESGRIEFSTDENSLTSYQWIYNGEPVVDQPHDKIISNPSSGWYRVVVTGANGCSSSSEIVTVR